MLHHTIKQTDLHRNYNTLCNCVPLLLGVSSEAIGVSIAMGTAGGICPESEVVIVGSSGLP